MAGFNISLRIADSDRFKKHHKLPHQIFFGTANCIHKQNKFRFLLSPHFRTVSCFTQSSSKLKNTTVGLLHQTNPKDARYKQP